LHAAARTGHLEAVDLLLARGSDPNEVESNHDQTALMWAANEGHVQIVSALLEAGADPNMRARMNLLTERTNADFPSGGFTALMWAARNGHEDIVRTLVAGGADINMRNADLASAMMISIVNDRFDMAELLLELGADANDSSLYEAVVMRDATVDWYARDGSRLRPDHDNENTALDLIAMLLERGADPNLRSGRQMHSATMCCDTRANASAFYRAAVAADVAALELLIEHGADVSWTPPSVDGGGLATNANAGKPALIVAMTGGQGVPLSAGPGYARQGPPPFREAANRSPVDAVALLLDAGADANAALPDGTPVLHEAVNTRYLEMVENLVAAGARLDAKNKDGLTALHIAEQLPVEDPDNPFGRATKQKGNAEPAQLADYLRQAMTNAGIPIEPAPQIESQDASGS
ncbi:MAG TPA: ankyrin repeat domain-containing protein, partial [Gammaproteobacteria bacterium]|nr:ankyrin repeat domain-containing protein [Gammaproteobacteria bacterium]